MRGPGAPIGRRERSKQDKRERIRAAARELFALHGVAGVTTQQIADHADIAIGTLYAYSATKAELLIMVQNKKFATAIDDGLAAASTATGTLDEVLALIRPVVTCLREHVENGRTYLHELAFGDPTDPIDAKASLSQPDWRAVYPPCSPATNGSTPRTRRRWHG